jgi:hypothetical protein
MSALRLAIKLFYLVAAACHRALKTLLGMRRERGQAQVRGDRWRELLGGRRLSIHAIQKGIHSTAEGCAMNCVSQSRNATLYGAKLAAETVTYTSQSSRQSNAPETRHQVPLSQRPSA